MQRLRLSLDGSDFLYAAGIWGLVQEPMSKLLRPGYFHPISNLRKGFLYFHQSYLDIVFWLTTHVLCTDQTGFSLSLACSGKYHLPVVCFFKFLQEKYLEHWIVTPGANLSEGKNIQLIFGGEGYKRSAVAQRCSRKQWFSIGHLLAFIIHRYVMLQLLSL